jgi:hypothetical protein
MQEEVEARDPWFCTMVAGGWRLCPRARLEYCGVLVRLSVYVAAKQRHVCSLSGGGMMPHIASLYLYAGITCEDPQDPAVELELEIAADGGDTGCSSRDMASAGRAAASAAETSGERNAQRNRRRLVDSEDEDGGGGGGDAGASATPRGCTQGKHATTTPTSAMGGSRESVGESVGSCGRRRNALLDSDSDDLKDVSALGAGGGQPSCKGGEQGRGVGATDSEDEVVSVKRRRVSLSASKKKLESDDSQDDSVEVDRQGAGGKGGGKKEETQTGKVAEYGLRQRRNKSRFADVEGDDWKQMLRDRNRYRVHV